MFGADRWKKGTNVFIWWYLRSSCFKWWIMKQSCFMWRCFWTSASSELHDLWDGLRRARVSEACVISRFISLSQCVLADVSQLLPSLSLQLILWNAPPPGRSLTGEVCLQIPWQRLASALSAAANGGHLKRQHPYLFSINTISTAASAAMATWANDGPQPSQHALHLSLIIHSCIHMLLQRNLCANYSRSMHAHRFYI